MKSKEEIVRNWLPRYTGEKLENFGKYILLTTNTHDVYTFDLQDKIREDILNLNVPPPKK